jgi:hypothetical protein
MTDDESIKADSLAVMEDAMAYFYRLALKERHRNGDADPKAIRDNFREAVTIAKEVASAAPCGAEGWARRRQLAVRISKLKSLAWDFSRSFGLRSRVGERVGVRGPHDAPAPAVAAERRESRLLRRRRAIVVQRLDAN